MTTANPLVWLTSSFKITCEVTGDPVPTVTFTRDGKRIVKDFKKVGKWTYKVDRAGTEHDGTYLCMAKNEKEMAKDEVKIFISKFRGYSKSMSLKKL